MKLQYYQPDETGNIASVMLFENEGDVNDWVKANCVLTEKEIVQSVDGSYHFKDSMDWETEESKRRLLEYEGLLNKFTSIVQAYMDSTAQTRGYDNIHTACSYVDDPDPIFATEGSACKQWRSRVWRKCYDILAEVKAGTRAIPTAEELIAELPKLEW